MEEEVSRVNFNNLIINAAMRLSKYINNSIFYQVLCNIKMYNNEKIHLQKLDKYKKYFFTIFWKLVSEYLAEKQKIFSFEITFIWFLGHFLNF